MMGQPFMPRESCRSDATNCESVCDKRYFAIGNLQDAADDGRTTAIVMFIMAGASFVLSVIIKCQRDVGLTNGVRTLKMMTRQRRASRQAVDLGV